MAAARAREVFRGAIQRMGVTANTPVAIAVSGGSDSLALTLLARQTFQRVIGITVDHRLREGSTLEAEKTGELVRSLGVEHHIVSLDWSEGEGGGRGGGLPRKGKVQVAAREKRYPALLHFCRKMDVRTLMVAHHLDDQNETFILRLSMGSGVSGLGCMYPSNVWAEFPQVTILRPLLEVRKADLQEVCRSEGVEWIEDPTNLSYDFSRNNIRRILQENEEVNPGITGLVKICQEARRRLKRQGSNGLKQINLHVNERHGYLSFNVSRLLSLPPLTVRTVWQSLMCHVGGARWPIPVKKYEEVLKHLLSGNKTARTCGNCVFFHDNVKDDTMIMARVLPVLKHQKLWTPISVGQTVHWDGRWRITLKPLKKLGRQSSVKPLKSNSSAGGLDSKIQFFVRHMIKPDYTEAKRGIRRINAVKLPSPQVRGGLPVICTESGYVVIAPHFGVNDHTYGVDYDMTFDPLLPLIEDSETHVY